MIEMDVHKRLQASVGYMDLHIQLRMQKGQFATLYGPSGAGKTSTLRILAGLMRPDSGSLVVNGKTWFHGENTIHHKPQDRKIGLVFQDYALFPHMSVLQNLQFALGKKGDPSHLKRLIAMIGLQGLEGRKPEELSGGQQQRVALARALVTKPDLLLLDEPLAALDIQVRLQLQEALSKLHREFHTTTLMISHDIGEIIKLSDMVFMIEDGKIVQQGAPEAIFIPKKVSGKFQFTGEVLKIEAQEVVYVVTIRIDSNVVKVIAGEDDVRNLRAGDKVLVASKAFNPILYKLH